MELDISIGNLSLMCGCCKSAIKRYLGLYKVSGLEIKGHRKSMNTYDFKTQVIKAFLSGKSKNEISIQYKGFTTVVFHWI